MNNDVLLPLSDAARMLGVTEDWLQRSGAPRRRLGHRTVRYHPGDLEEWVRGRCLACGREVLDRRELIDGECPDCRH